MHRNPYAPFIKTEGYWPYVPGWQVDKEELDRWLTTPPEDQETLYPDLEASGAMLGDVVYDVVHELRRAQEIFPPMRSAHEGYAVVLEELDELWEAIRAKKDAPDHYQHMREEAIQLAAMSIRFIYDVVRDPTAPGISYIAVNVGECTGMNDGSCPVHPNIPPVIPGENYQQAEATCGMLIWGTPNNIDSGIRKHQEHCVDCQTALEEAHNEQEELEEREREQMLCSCGYCGA